MYVIWDDKGMMNWQCLDQSSSVYLTESRYVNDKIKWEVLNVGKGGKS